MNKWVGLMLMLSGLTGCASEPVPVEKVDDSLVAAKVIACFDKLNRQDWLGHANCYQTDSLKAWLDKHNMEQAEQTPAQRFADYLSKQSTKGKVEVKVLRVTPQEQGYLVLVESITRYSEKMQQILTQAIHLSDVKSGLKLQMQ